MLEKLMALVGQEVRIRSPYDFPVFGVLQFDGIHFYVVDEEGKYTFVAHSVTDVTNATITWE